MWGLILIFPKITTMSKKITYLLGAGASANTIPVVADMYQRITEIVKFLESFVFTPGIKTQHEFVPENLADILNEIISDLKWLLVQSENSPSIDTLAKQFYLTGDHEPGGNYEKLKQCLINYFTIEQLLNINIQLPGKVYVKSIWDKRYDSFIASIAYLDDNKFKLNNNIRIISWNYDLQFELCLKRFSRKTINEVKRTFQIYPLLNERLENDWQQNHDPNEFSVWKLNGNAIFSTSDSKRAEDYTVYDKCENDSQYNNLCKLLKEFKELDFNNNTACRYFNFSWESLKNFRGRKYDQHERNIMEAAHIAEQTEILVVIGYSFPIFNREIDNRIFKKMENVRKVYIQDKEPEKIKATMKNAFDITQKKIQVGIDANSRIIEEDLVDFYLNDNTNQFVIPYELNQ
jgi:hypothetical protein